MTGSVPLVGDSSAKRHAGDGVLTAGSVSCHKMTYLLGHGPKIDRRDGDAGRSNRLMAAPGAAIGDPREES